MKFLGFAAAAAQIAYFPVECFLWADWSPSQLTLAAMQESQSSRLPAFVKM